ncbi:MAG: hypothetical protein CVU22_24540 [Betaproteobacteria bacterium HGW-Betaproteobacteria-16]|nr:MAG: hypothetical protein CVU22_24540 [Betaproteobacteria bacterium HGW-Betaproteobacteria-16]
MDANSSLATKTPGPPDNPFNRLDARTGMALAYWAYPHRDIKSAEKVIAYPDPWRHAQPGIQLPANWPTANLDANGRLKPDSPEGWNTQHNPDGKLENRFMVSINPRTQEITFDFKGSDAWSNWKSDLGNAGASEFAKIEGQAQAALNALQADERYKDYRFAATGHSLGGGMAQSFALRNQLDAYVYNSLPIARDTLRGGYFDSVGGVDAALARYQASGRQVHDVRTPNDIATFAYEGVMQNQYLSHHAGAGPALLPGAAVPDLLKTVLMASQVGTLPATALMGRDHTMGALVDAQHGLSLGAHGAYRIPEGHVDFANVPPKVRKLFAELSHSPVVKAIQTARPDDFSPHERFVITRENGSQQHIAVHTGHGDVEIDHYDQDGSHTRVELNVRRGQPAKVSGFDSQGRPLREEWLALQSPRNNDPEHNALLDKALRETSEQLTRQGLNPTQVEQVCAAAVTHCAQHARHGRPEAFLVSGDGEVVGVMHENHYLSEMPIAPALQQDAAAHLAQAARLQHGLLHHEPLEVAPQAPAEATCSRGRALHP